MPALYKKGATAPIKNPAPEENGRTESVMVPLKATQIRATIIDFVADVEISQRYYNDTNSPLEAVYAPLQILCFSALPFKSIKN